MLRVAAAITASASAAALIALYRSRRRVKGPWLLQRCTVLRSTLTDAPIAAEQDGYVEVDVRLDANGMIEAVEPAGGLTPRRLSESCIDCHNKLLLPGDSII